MKDLRILGCLAALCFCGVAYGQSPSKMSFQAVIRDLDGQLVSNRAVGLRMSVIRGGAAGAVVFSETHASLTNINGLVSLEIGSGATGSGFFSAIDWSLGPYFLKTEADVDGGSSYSVVGVTQLLSVPYALHAKTAENGDQLVTLLGSGGTTVTGVYPNFVVHSEIEGSPNEAGTGIEIVGTTITNTAPDIPVVISGDGATTVSGTYPNFTISSTDANTTYEAGSGISIANTTITNTAPDQEITLTGGGTTMVTGSYPDFTITSAGGTPYSAGPGIDISGTTIVNTAPDLPITLSGAGSTIVSGNYPDFTITSVGGSNPYSAGQGIDITGTTIINTAPDLPITLSGAGSTIVSGNYPDFTITSVGGITPYSAGPGIDISGTTIINTAPDEPVTLVGAGSTTVSGSYPNFIVSSTDNNTTYSAGPGIDIVGTTILNTAPDEPVTLVGAGSTTVSGSYPNFIVSSTDNNTTYNAGPGIDIVGTTILNTAPDIPLNLNAGPGVAVSGSYPDLTVSLAPSNTHYVGEMFGGGIVFYIYDNGVHGLIASLTNIGTVSPWHLSPFNTTATSYYDGSSNTAQIVGAHGNGAYAAKICKDYTSGGYTDWYLPSIWELNVLYQSGFMVSYKLSNDGNPGTSPLTATGSYWSSTQFDSDLAYMIYFPDGTPYLDFKNKTYRIRAVRRF